MARRAHKVSKIPLVFKRRFFVDVIADLKSFSSTMDFWGVTVEPNKPVLVEPKFHTVIHISEAAIGKAKSKETVHLNVEVGGQNFVMGTVTPQKSKSFDLLFSEKFTLSHNSASPVHFIGYKMPDLDDTSPSSKPNERPVDDDEAGVGTTSLSNDTANTTTMAKKQSKKRRTK